MRERVLPACVTEVNRGNISDAKKNASIPQGGMPAMWRGRRIAGTPHRHESLEQLASKSNDTMRELPYEAALGNRQDYTAARLEAVLREVSGRLDEQMRWWPAWRGQEQHPWEPPRVATGIPERPRRIESLGLAVVPWQAYPIFALIKEMDDILTELNPDYFRDGVGYLKDADVVKSMPTLFDFLGEGSR